MCYKEKSGMMNGRRAKKDKRWGFSFMPSVWKTSLVDII